MYKYMNVNPMHNNIEDCTVRSISVAEGISWDKAYDKLSDSARELGLMMNSVEAVEEYLDRRYYTVPHYSKYVKEFIKEYPKGTYLVTMPGHITVIKDGVLYDTFDCRNRKMWNAWKII